jgi:hypothetical protein
MKHLLPVVLFLALVVGGGLYLNRGFGGFLIALAAGFIASLGFFLDSKAKKKRSGGSATSVEHKSGKEADGNRITNTARRLRKASR